MSLPSTPQGPSYDLRSVLEGSPIGIAVLEIATGRRLFVNSALLEMFGASSADELFDGNIELTWVNADDLKRAFSIFQNREILVNFEAERKRIDGTKWWVLMNTQPIRFDGIDAGIVWHIDITQRKKTESELRNTLSDVKRMQGDLIQSEKMASLGNLVAGVAHEINTPIGISVTGVSHLEEKIETLSTTFASGDMTKSDLAAFIDTATQSTRIVTLNLQRAIKLIGSFKQVSVDQTSQEKRRFGISSHLDDVLTTLQPELRKHGHQVSISCDPKLKIESYPGALSQVFSNLIMNSILHGFEGIRQGEIRIDVSAQESQIHFVYTDNGCGMSQAICDRIFDPFFTTKRGKGGTGLGMNILYNLVTQALVGSVTCISDPGNGARFNLSIRNLAN